MYPLSNSITLAYTLLNEILKIANSKEKAEDLFNIYLEPDSDSYEEFYWDNRAHLISKYKELTYLRESFYRYSGELTKFLVQTQEWEEYWKNTLNKKEVLVIKAKDETKSTKNITDLFFDLFTIEIEEN